MKHTIELRRGTLSTTPDGNTLEGVAVPFGSASRVLHDRARPYREVFERGAVKVSDQTVALFGHDPSGVPLARVGSGTLSFDERADGLHFSMRLPEARADLAEALRRGDLTGAVSIGFVLQPGGDSWSHRSNPSLRRVRSAELVELSIVQQGAYEGAQGTLT